MSIIIIILLIVTAALVVFLVLLKNEIRSINRQLYERMNFNKKPIDVSLFDKDVTKLASEINKAIFYCQEQNIEILKREMQLKESISNISHDLRTPLTSIVGYLQLLQKTDLQPEQQEFVETILSRSMALRRLITDFYSISVWETKENSPSLVMMNLDNILMDTVLSYTEQFETQSMMPHVIFGDEPSFVLANEDILKRVIDNIISNAISYGMDELNITIAKKDMVSVTFQNSVQDGQAIDIDRLFNKFYTADLSRSHSGTGLGLYIVRLLMEKMGGTVEALLERNHISIILFFPNF